MILQHHPDGFIYIRDGFNVTYAATLDEFSLDNGLPIRGLPNGMVGFTYHSNEKVLSYHDAFGNAFPVEGRNGDVEFDGIIARSTSLVAARQQSVATAQEMEISLLAAQHPKVQ